MLECKVCRVSLEIIFILSLAQPTIAALTVQQTSSSSFTLTCTSTGSPATTVTWRRNGQLLTIDGNTFEMTQTVTNRAASTYENVLIIDQPQANFAGNTVTCTVENSLGTATGNSLLAEVNIL